jgi:hypothetical protein
MTRKPATVRNQESRQRKKDRGLTRTEVLVYEEDRDAVHAYAAALRAARQPEHQDHQQ